MHLEISTIMMIFFILFLIMSIWKIYAFLPNKQLEDDDSTPQAQKAITDLLLCIIDENKGDLDNKELFIKMKEDKRFDKKRFWRFNQNKLNQLLHHYYNENPDLISISDIYHKNRAV